MNKIELKNEKGEYKTQELIELLNAENTKYILIVEMHKLNAIDHTDAAVASYVQLDKNKKITNIDSDILLYYARKYDIIVKEPDIVQQVTKSTNGCVNIKHLVIDKKEDSPTYSLYIASCIEFEDEVNCLIKLLY